MSCVVNLSRIARTSHTIPPKNIDNSLFSDADYCACLYQRLFRDFQYSLIIRCYIILFIHVCIPRFKLKNSRLRSYLFHSLQIQTFIYCSHLVICYINRYNTIWYHVSAEHSMSIPQTKINTNQIKSLYSSYFHTKQRFLSKMHRKHEIIRLVQEIRKAHC